MELDVRINKSSLSIAIENPFRLDLDDLVGRIDRFAVSEGERLNGLDVRGLLPLMVKGIAGCEAGCPANAKSLVEQGYRNFALEYIEGGILSAAAPLGTGRTISIKLFPDF